MPRRSGIAFLLPSRGIAEPAFLAAFGNVWSRGRHRAGAVMAAECHVDGPYNCAAIFERG
jgi:hypothetical protein